MSKLCKCMHDRVPDGAGGGKRGRCYATASLDGGTGGQPLEAVAMQGAIARPVVSRGPDDPHMPELRVVTAEDGFSGHDEPDADTGSNRYVSEVGESLCVTPAALCQRGADNIGRQSQRYCKP